MKLYYDHAKAVMLRTSDDDDGSNLVEITKRLQAVIEGCETLEMSLKRCIPGHIQHEGILNDGELFGSAWIRQGAILVELPRKRHISSDIVPVAVQTVRSDFQHVFTLVPAHNPNADNVRYSMKLYYDHAKAVMLRTSDDDDCSDLLEIPKRLQAVIEGCETLERTLKRCIPGHIQHEGILSDGELFGSARIRQGARSVEMLADELRQGTEKLQELKSGQKNLSEIFTDENTRSTFINQLLTFDQDFNDLLTKVNHEQQAVQQELNAQHSVDERLRDIVDDLTRLTNREKAENVEPLTTTESVEQRLKALDNILNDLKKKRNELAEMHPRHRGRILSIKSDCEQMITIIQNTVMTTEKLVLVFQRITVKLNQISVNIDFIKSKIDQLSSIVTPDATAEGIMTIKTVEETLATVHPLVKEAQDDVIGLPPENQQRFRQQLFELENQLVTFRTIASEEKGRLEKLAQISDAVKQMDRRVKSLAKFLKKIEPTVAALDYNQPEQIEEHLNTLKTELSRCETIASSINATVNNAAQVITRHESGRSFPYAQTANADQCLRPDKIIQKSPILKRSHSISKFCWLMVLNVLLFYCSDFPMVESYVISDNQTLDQSETPQYNRRKGSASDDRKIWSDVIDELFNKTQKAINENRIWFKDVKETKKSPKNDQNFPTVIKEVAAIAKDPAVYASKALTGMPRWAQAVVAVTLSICALILTVVGAFYIFEMAAQKKKINEKIRAEESSDRPHFPATSPVTIHIHEGTRPAKQVDQVAELVKVPAKVPDPNALNVPDPNAANAPDQNVV